MTGDPQHEVERPWLGEHGGEIEAAREVERLSQEVSAARTQAVRAEQALQVLAAPGVQSVVLAGLGPSPGAKGRAYVNPSTRDALFYAFDLPPLPADKTYELWFIAAGKPVGAAA